MTNRAEPQHARRANSRAMAAYAAFFLSGASSLIFQTIWTRMLHHVFGAAPVAISTVLTVFMGGLGLGAWLGGKYANRIRHPIITYAVAEIGVGIWGLVIPLLVQSDGWLSTVNAFLRSEFGAESGLFMIARFLCVAPILAIPTTLMGSTLPLLTRHFVSTEHRAQQASAQVGVLYAVNTFGAASGPLLSAFVLLPNVGLTTTNIVACSMNFSLAALIFLARKPLLRGTWKPGEPLLFWPGTAETAAPSSEAATQLDEDETRGLSPDEADDDPASVEQTSEDGEGKATSPPKKAAKSKGAAPKSAKAKSAKAKSAKAKSGRKKSTKAKTAAAKAQSAASRDTEQAIAESEPVEAPIPELARKAAFFAFAASGAAALCYEVVWSRALAMTIGSSIYSFALILETFLIGIAGGAAAMSAFLGRKSRPYIGVALAAVALVVLANVPLAIDIVDPQEQTRRLTGSLSSFFLVCLLYCAPIFLALIWIYRRLESERRGDAAFRGNSEAWRPLVTVLIAAVPVIAAGVNVGRFPGFLPQIILSVVASVALFIVLASLLSRTPVLLVAVIQLFIAGATTVSYVWQDEIPYAFAQLVVSIPQHALWQHVGTVQFFMFLTVVLCTLPATLGMGAMFPLVVRVWTSGGDKVARDVANVYTGNTVGSIVGAWLPGFVLFVLVGAERTLHIGVALNVLLALVMLIAGASDPKEDQRWWTWRRLLAVALPILVHTFFLGVIVLDGTELPEAIANLGGGRIVRAALFAPLYLLVIGEFHYLKSRSREGAKPPNTGDLAALALPFVAAFGLASLLGTDGEGEWALGAITWVVRAGLVATAALVAWANFRERVSPPDEVSKAKSTDAEGEAEDSDEGTLPAWHALTVYILSPLIPALLALLWLGTKDPDSELRWNPTQMTLGVFRVSLAQGMLDPESWGAPDLVYYNDGLTTTVSVERWGRHYALKNNGKVDASNGDDMPTQINVAAYPLLLHPRGPEDLDVAIVGFGSGVTVGTALRFPVQRVDVVELERSIPEAARFFEDVNQLDYRLDHWPYVEMDRLTIVNDDGRNFLASTEQQYDVIISEPSNPWITGVSDLFTVDHWRITKQRLRPGGIYCQWVQLYEMSPENIKTIYRTFASQFEHVVVLSADDRSSDTVMLGSDQPIRLDLPRVRAAYALEGVSAELERANVYSPFDIFARTLLANRDEVMAFTEIEERRRGSEWVTDARSPNAGACELPSCRRRPAILNTDDNARIEFSAPRDLIGFARFEGYLSQVYAEEWPYGNPLSAQSADGETVLTGFGDGDEAARNYAELAMSMIAHGRYGWAGDLIERSQASGRARETAVALEVLTHLLTSENEPSVRIEPPIPGPEMDRDTARALADGFDEVRASVDERAYSAALVAMENIPAPLRLHSGPALRFLYGYLLYKAADGSYAQYRSAIEHLEDLVRTEEDYVLRHPEVYYFLARSHDAEGAYSNALRAMRAYVEARLVPTNNDAQETPEPPVGQAPSTNREGESDKTEHPDRG